MSTQIFVNLPVKELGRSVAFFKQLGYTFNPQFTDENATCMNIAENIFAMLLVEKCSKGARQQHGRPRCWRPSHGAAPALRRID